MYGPCVVAVQASFEAVGAGIVGEVVVDGFGAVPEFIVHAYDGGRMLRAVGRIGEGRHHLQLLFRHCGMDEHQPRGYVFGPARVEFWRYSSEAIVWMDEHAALQNTVAWVSLFVNIRMRTRMGREVNIRMNMCNINCFNTHHIYHSMLTCMGPRAIHIAWMAWVLVNFLGGWRGAAGLHR